MCLGLLFGADLIFSAIIAPVYLKKTMNHSTTDVKPVLSKENRSQVIHDLRDELNTIVTSAMLLNRLDAVGQEHKKYVEWILEKAQRATELVNDLDRHVNGIACDTDPRSLSRVR